MKKKISYKVDFPIAVMNVLEEMAETDNKDKEDILREAIALYSYVHKEVKDGDKYLTITDKFEEVVKVIKLLPPTNLQKNEEIKC